MTEQVHKMFSEIAPTYDTANQVLSFGVHHFWRNTAVRLSQAKTGDQVLDCATGTGDLAITFKKKVGPQGSVIGTDFCAPMLEPAPAKAKKAGVDIAFEVADVMALPYTDRRFDVSSISFGIRNVDDPVKALSELGRVTKKGGRVIVLEFGQPTGVFGALFRFYSRFVMPTVGGLISGKKEAYQYLPRTSAAFPAGDNFVALMRQSNAFETMEAHPLLFGTAWVYVGRV